MPIIELGREGEITMPHEVRQWLGVEAGDRIVFVRSDDHVVLYQLSRTLHDLRGSVPVSDQQDFSAIRNEVERARSEQMAADAPKR